MNKQKSNYKVKQSFPKDSMEAWILYLITRNKLENSLRKERQLAREFISFWDVSEPIKNNILNYMNLKEKINAR